MFSRETLINDRRREAAFLEEELTNRKNATFEPELRRDLATISALTAQLGIKFDPGVELNFERKEELDSLRQDIARTKLEAQLELAQRELEDVRAGESDSVTGPESEQLTNSVTAPDTADIKGKLTSLVTETTNFLKAIGEQGDGLARPSAVGQSPENDFEDRQAFRQRIRARLAAMNLDDVHDSDGNALYRLQFRAAIAPGPNDRRWGVALVTAKPPTLDETELTRLYYQWLSHINARMYARTEADGTVALESLYLRAGAPAGLYSVAQVCLPVDTTPAARGRCREGETQFYIAVHPAVAATITEHLADDRKRQAAKKALASSVCNNTKLAQDILNAQISVEASIAGFSAEAGAFGAQILTAARIVIADYDRVYSLARNYLGICRASIEPALNSKRVELENADRAYQSALAASEGSDAQDAQGDTGGTPSGSSSVRQDPNELKTTVDGLSEEVRILELQYDQTSLTQLREPVNFCIHVATNGTGDECSKNTSERRPIVVGGTSYAYDAAPAEQAQRISTVSSAARSMQFALALAASVPSASVGAEAGLGTLNSVASKIDARERAPLVVGFSEAGRATARSDTDDANAMSGAAEPYGAAFGWVFGPRVNFEGDGNTLALAHTAASHQVVADLSLPAWWPYVSLEVRSEWAGSGWIGETPDLVQRKTPQQAMNVRLPTTKADLDLLTDHLFAEATGIEITQPTIATVTPATVVLGCAPLSVLLVEGEDLWRGSEAHFLGTRHQSLQVLPDMGGLRITFDLSDAAVAADAPEHELTVWTRRGPARKTVNLIRGNTACPGDSVGTGPQISLAQQHFIEGGPFALALPGGLPEAYHALAFYAQLAESGDSGNRKVTPEGNAPQIAAGGRDLTVPQWSLDGNPFGAPGRPVAGDLLHVGLELKPTPAKTRYIRAAGEVVYYPTGGGKASRSPDEVPNPASRIEITLPEKATKAFPALLHPETRLTAAATPNGGSAIELRSQRNVQQLLDDGVAEPAKLLVSINDFSPSGALEPHRTKDITIAFEFAGPPGAHLPAIEGTVKLAKTP